jgi:hypothetical protein
LGLCITNVPKTPTLNASHRAPPPPQSLPGFPIRHSLPSTRIPLTPLFARLYLQVLSSQDFTRIWSSPLAPTPQKQRSYVLSTKKFFTGSISWKNRKSCTHIKISGVRCGSPSLRGEQFCYYHQRMHRGVRTPPQSRLHPLACIEDKESIQAALAEVINALLRNTIDMKRATLILRALHIAVKNDARASVKAQANNIVKEIPEYDEIAPTRIADGLIDLEVPFEASFGQDPRASKPQRSYRTPEEFEKQRNESIANYYGFPTAEAHAAAKEKGWTPYTQAEQATRKTEPTTAPVGTAAIGCPGGPAVSVRSAVPPSALTPHGFTRSSAKSPQPSPASNRANSGALSPRRKPPTPVKDALSTGKSLKTRAVAAGQN